MGRPHNYLQIFLKSLSAPIKSKKSFWILKRNWKIKEKKKQGAFCKVVVDFNPDDRRRVAATVLAVSTLPRPPLAAHPLAPVPQQPRRRRGGQLRRPSPRFPSNVAVASSPSSTQIGPARCSSTRRAWPRPSRTCPDPARPHSATPRAPLPRIREEFPPASRGRACTPSTVRRLLRYKTTPHPSGRSTPPYSLAPPLQFHREPPGGRALPKLCRRRGPSWPQRLADRKSVV